MMAVRRKNLRSAGPVLRIRLLCDKVKALAWSRDRVFGGKGGKKDPGRSCASWVLREAALCSYW